MCDLMQVIAVAIAAGGGLALLASPAHSADLNPVVEVEEDVYSFTYADNGAGPTWCNGSSCIVRVGEDVFATGIETIPDAKPMNNVRWRLFHRSERGWEAVAKGQGRTREPCPLACFQDRAVFLSDNPTLAAPDAYAGPARPEVLQFCATRPCDPYQTLLPVWDGQPDFTEHSYRSFAADGRRRELILFQNVGYTHAEWAFRDAQGNWSARGQLKWPWGAEYPQPQPIRVCYPTVALKDRKLYFCGVSDIEEPYPEWRAYKKELTGRDWDYDFRRLFFTWSDDVTAGRFHDWVEISSRDKSCGWMMPCDLWVGPDGAVHLLWTERAIDERLREKFFPGEKQSQALMYAVVRDGKVEQKHPLVIVAERERDPTVGDGRFHAAADGRLLVWYYLSGTGPDGDEVSENRLLEVRPDGTQSEPVKVALKHAIRNAFTATWRAGCAPSDVLDVYGVRADGEHVMAYARIRIK